MAPDCRMRAPQAACDRCRGIGPPQSRPQLLDQEFFLGQLGAFHFLAHPARRETSAGPLQALVFSRLILRLRLRTRTTTSLGLWYPHDGADDARSFLGYVALQFGEVAFKDGALRLNFQREQPFEIVNETAELIDLH